MHRRLRFLRLFVLVLIAGTGFSPVPATALESSEAVQVEKLYKLKCAKCHEFYDPKAYDKEKWDEWMLKMKKKARLKDDQFDLLNAYLNEIRSS